MLAFADPAIKAIFSTIGGDDSIRILPYLDLQVMRSNPKIFMGCSDTTISHLACYQAGCLFYGPSIMPGLLKTEDCSVYGHRGAKDLVFQRAIA
jgi:muramoyltetrapeptide carboxypeptidase LdcA involved in peptidoglycan recycling